MPAYAHGGTFVAGAPALGEGELRRDLHRQTAQPEAARWVGA